jgi:hypothetical protein
MLPVSKRTISSAIAGAIVLVAIGLGWRQVGGTSSPQQAVASVPPDPASLISAFRGPRSPSDALPQRSRDAIAKARDSVIATLEADQARRLIASANEIVYAIPGTQGQICLTIHSPQSAGDASTGCAPLEVLENGDKLLVNAGGQLDGEYLVSGLAADGVHALRATTSAGTTLDVPIQRNAFALAAPSSVATLSWMAPDGTEKTMSLAAPDNG